MPPRQRQRSKKNIVTKKQLHTMINGRSFMPPIQPRLTHVSPWWPATFSYGATGDASLSVNFLANTFRDQFGLYKTDATHRIDIALRFQRMTVWNLNTSRPILVCIHGLVANDFTTVLEDWPAPNRLARIGYQWPRPDQLFVFDDAATKIVFKIDNGSNQPWLGYVSVLWRPTVQSSITSSFIHRYYDDQSGGSNLLELPDAAASSRMTLRTLDSPVQSDDFEDLIPPLALQ